MKEVFINKFNNKKYISKYLYDVVKGELYLSKFDIDKYNDIILKNELIDEGIPFAEERRLFYVALTRTKNKVFLLVNEDMNDRSIFINEIYQIIKENTTS